MTKITSKIINKQLNLRLTNHILITDLLTLFYEQTDNSKFLKYQLITKLRRAKKSTNHLN